MADYAAHYARLIARARRRVLEGYTERHHVLPRCMGGGDDSSNLVDLTPEEHYVAHQLLAKMYPEHHGLVWAAIRMARQCSGRRAYAWLRKRQADAQRGKPSGKLAFTGRKHSDETRARMSAKRRGVPKSPEHTAKIAASLFGNKRGSALRGRKMSAEFGACMSAIRSGKKLSAEHRAAISAGLKGNTNRHGPRVARG